MEFGILIKIIKEKIMKFIKKIYEIFDTKNYNWLKSEGSQSSATFEIKDNQYYVCFDEIYTNVYNHYFYLKKEDKMIFSLMNYKSGESFKILSNVKHIIDDFLNRNPYIEFIGFSSFDNERNDLYVMYMQYIQGENLKGAIIKEGERKRRYYFIYNENIEKLLLNKYIEEFIKKDKRLKK